MTMNRDEILARQKELLQEVDQLDGILRAQESTPEWAEEAKAEIAALSGKVSQLESQISQVEEEKQELYETTIERDQLSQELNQNLNLAKQQLSDITMQLEERTNTLKNEREKATDLEIKLSFIKNTLPELAPHVRMLGREIFEKIQEKI